MQRRADASDKRNYHKNMKIRCNYKCALKIHDTLIQYNNHDLSRMDILHSGT